MAIRVFAAGVIATDVRHGRETPPLTEGTDLEVEEQRAKTLFARLGDTGATRRRPRLVTCLPTTTSTARLSAWPR